jgi:hypothetical protein
LEFGRTGGVVGAESSRLGSSMSFRAIKISKVARAWGLVSRGWISCRLVRSVDRRLAHRGHNRPHRLVHSSTLCSRCG